MFKMTNYLTDKKKHNFSLIDNVLFEKIYIYISIRFYFFYVTFTQIRLIIFYLFIAG